jgi:hypothetical protein
MSQSFEGFWNFEKKSSVQSLSIKCDVMGFHPKAIAIFPNLKYESFSTIKIRVNTFSFFHQGVSLKCFNNSFCKMIIC